MESYFSGLIGGVFVGWIFGQMWQAFQDRSLLRLITQRVQESSESEDQEVIDFFEELSDPLDKGRSVGSEPVRFPVKKGGGYVSNAELEETSKKHADFQPLSRADELDIMRTFQDIVGMAYQRASKVVQEQGYTLHPIYINSETKRPANVYSATTLGVRVKDPNFDILSDTLSPKAVIAEIIDVGGRDIHNRGKIRL